jgi:hypothetical protein
MGDTMDDQDLNPGGRPRKYDPDRPATAAERKRAQREREREGQPIQTGRKVTGQKKPVTKRVPPRPTPYCDLTDRERTDAMRRAQRRKVRQAERDLEAAMFGMIKSRQPAIDTYYLSKKLGAPDVEANAAWFGIVLETAQQLRESSRLWFLKAAEQELLSRSGLRMTAEEIVEIIAEMEQEREDRILMLVFRHGLDGWSATVAADNPETYALFEPEAVLAA